MSSMQITNLSEFRRWIANSRVGDDVVYHIEYKRERNAMLFSAMEQASDNGLVMLYQQRTPENPMLFEWRARRISPTAARFIRAVSKSILVPKRAA